MPFIELKTTQSITDGVEKELKTAFGEVITLIGKSEPWLMLNFIDNQRMWFKGSSDPAAILEVKLYGAASPKSYDNLTAKLTELVADTLGIDSTRVYVKYDEIEHWGYAGSNF